MSSARSKPLQRRRRQEERLVVDVQADDLGVRHVDDGLTQLREAVGLLAVDDGPRLVEAVDVGAVVHHRLPLVARPPHAQVAVRGGEQRLGRGQVVLVEARLDETPRVARVDVLGASAAAVGHRSRSLRGTARVPTPQRVAQVGHHAIGARPGRAPRPRPCDRRPRPVRIRRPGRPRRRQSHPRRPRPAPARRPAPAPRRRTYRAPACRAVPAAPPPGRRPATRTGAASPAPSRIASQLRLEETTARRTPWRRRCRTTASDPSYTSTPSLASRSPKIAFFRFPMPQTVSTPGRIFGNAVVQLDVRGRRGRCGPRRTAAARRRSARSRPASRTAGTARRAPPPAPAGSRRRSASTMPRGAGRWR